MKEKEACRRIDNLDFYLQHYASLDYGESDHEAMMMAKKALEQEPKKGHWKLVQRGKCIDVCCSNCKAVRIKEYAYNYTIDQLDKEDVEECLESHDMRYCPYCGSDNREVK